MTQPPRTSAGRRIGLIAGAVLLVTAAGHGGVWWWAVSTIEREVTANLAAPPLSGWQASAGTLRRGGWPLAATVEIPALAASGPLGNAPGDPWRWQAERMSVSIAFAHPRTLVVAVDGQQSLQAGTAPPVPFTARRLHAEVLLEPGLAPRAIAIDVTELQARLPAGPLGLMRLEISAAQHPAAQKGEAALAVTITAQGAAVPPGWLPPGWTLGPVIERFLTDLVVTGPVPRSADLADRATAWRDGGGTVELRRLELGWGEVTLSGAATLALDGQLQPAGTATARVAGHAVGLRALSAAGVLAPRSAMAAGAGLALLARPPAQGGAPVVEVPFSLHNRTLALVVLGRIPLVRVPELVWRPPP